MASVNQTRPHCVNQMGKTHSKPLAARHGKGMLCVIRPLCFRLWPVRPYNIFLPNPLNGTIFEKKKFEHQICVLIFSTTFVCNISHSQHCSD